MVIHIFIKLSQIMCLISIHILACQHTRCNYKLWNVSWFCCVLNEYSYIIFMSEMSYFHKTFTDRMFNQYTHFDRWNCQVWLHSMEGFMIKFCFFSAFSYTCLKRYISTKLSQTVSLVVRCYPAIHIFILLQMAQV